MAAGATKLRMWRVLVLAPHGDGVASFGAHEVWFVVPSKAWTPPVLL